MEKMITIQFNMRLPAVITKKVRWFVAYCPALDVASQGETEEEAKKNLTEALLAFLLSCHERGVLDAVLKESGFIPARSMPTAVNIKDDFEYINVPLPFMIDMGNHHRCHA